METPVDKSPDADGRRHRYVYGVYGLSEWVALIPAGKARLRICFTGGGTSGHGTSAASFATRDASIATLIERSSYFRTGRIVRLR